MSELFLFCGGPKIYGQGLSKPLRVMPSGNTLLKTYLSHVRESFDKPIWLLIEESDSEIIEASLAASNFGEVGIFSCPNGSSTLQKLDFLLKNSPHSHSSMLFSYPDIFFGAGVPDLGHGERNEFFMVGVHKHRVRFPRMNRLPYESSIRSVERFSQLDSTNPTWVFSGIFAADSTLVEQRLRSFRLSFDGSWESANLETDFFAYLANLNLLQAVEHQDTWIQADSERDLIRIEDMVQC